MASLNHATIIKGFEKLAEDRDSENFFFDFLKVLKFSAATIKCLKMTNGNRNVAVYPGDFALAKKIYFHTAHAGEDLTAVLRGLVADERLEKQKIRFFLTTDFDSVVAYDRLVDDWTSFDFTDLRENYEFFLPLTGLYEKLRVRSVHPADVKACEKMGKLYDVIRVQNHFEKEQLHDLNVFLTRLLFCFFAEDTGIFPVAGQLTKAIESLTKPDGSDTPEFFERLFGILDMPPDHPGRRQETVLLSAFPYVNGGLFKEKIRVPTFNARARNILIECGRLEWKEISPVIFGSMFQSVMDPELRHERGAHYTSEKNIFKVIDLLFLDDLKAELSDILELKVKGVRKRRLKEFQQKIANIRIADPACGCGNFLVVSYRELKTLELQAVEAILKTEDNRDRSVFMDWTKDYSKVSIDQFYGIEIEEFPVDIARVSMWLMEHVMNCRFGKLLGTVIPSIPLKTGAQIVCANALTTDWTTVFPVQKLSYIIGNPPFGGASTISKVQKAEVRAVFNGVSAAGTLDYVTAWYGKSAALLDKNAAIECAFVSTNSICQGEQVAPLWGGFFKRDIHINFAHQTFQWRNEAKDNAGVYCVVIGFGKREREHKRLFLYDNPKAEPKSCEVKQINAYLLETDETVFITSQNNRLSAPLPMVSGNKPADGGNLIIEPEDYEKFASIEALAPYIKKFMGSKEFLHNLPRYCLWLVDAPETVLQLPLVAERIAQCRKTRNASKKDATRACAATPHLFQDRRYTYPPESEIVVPCISSERREYIPLGFVADDTIVSNRCSIVPNGTLYDFGILESRLHMTWMRTVCGRLKSDYNYSGDLCYNTFPWPKVSEAQREVIENLAGNVLIAREMHPDMTLADLYDPDMMPDDLRKAHTELDVAVEALYRKHPFEGDEDRLLHLFERYEKLLKGEDSAVLYDKD